MTDYIYTDKRCPECNAKMIEIRDGDKVETICEREYLVANQDKPYTPDDLKKE